jgi:uncharacterized membrane protein
VWHGLTTFGRGLFIALCGILIQSSSALVKEDTLSLTLTTIGIIIFIVGLYMALLGMDSQFREFKEVMFLGKKKK